MFSALLGLGEAGDARGTHSDRDSSSQVAEVHYATGTMRIGESLSPSCAIQYVKLIGRSRPGILF